MPSSGQGEVTPGLLNLPPLISLSLSLHEWGLGGGLSCTTEWTACLLSEGTGSCHTSQAFHVAQNTCLCIQSHLLPAIRALVTHRFKCYSWQRFLFSSASSPQWSGSSSLSEWAVFLLKTCFGFCCFVFLVWFLFFLCTTLFYTGSLVCVSSLPGFSEELVPSRNGRSPLECFKNFLRSIHWESDTKILNLHIELEEKVLVA